MDIVKKELIELQKTVLKLVKDFQQLENSHLKLLEYLAKYGYKHEKVN